MVRLRKSRYAVKVAKRTLGARLGARPTDRGPSEVVEVGEAHDARRRGPGRARSAQARCRRRRGVFETAPPLRMRRVDRVYRLLPIVDAPEPLRALLARRRHRASPTSQPTGTRSLARRPSERRAVRCCDLHGIRDFLKRTSAGWSRTCQHGTDRLAPVLGTISSGTIPPRPPVGAPLRPYGGGLVRQLVEAATRRGELIPTRSACAYIFAATVARSDFQKSRSSRRDAKARMSISRGPGPAGTRPVTGSRDELTSAPTNEDLVRGPIRPLALRVRLWCGFSLPPPLPECARRRLARSGPLAATWLLGSGGITVAPSPAHPRGAGVPATRSGRWRRPHRAPSSPGGVLLPRHCLLPDLLDRPCPEWHRRWLVPPTLSATT